MVCYTRGKRERERLVQFYQKGCGQFPCYFTREKFKEGHIRYGSAFWMELDFGRGFVFIITAATGQLCWFRGQDGVANGFWGRLGLF